MSMRNFTIFTTLSLLVGTAMMPCAAHAEPESKLVEQTASDGAVTYQSGIDGPKIEYDKDGNLLRMSNKYTQPVGFPDRRGVHTAYVIAEEKAKAGIIRFIKEEVATGRAATEVENDLSKTESQRSPSDQKVSETAQRTIIQNLTEVTQSAAVGTLSGVVVIDQGYDEKAAEVWVVVGVSKKSKAAANALKSLSEDSETTTVASKRNADLKGTALSSIPGEAKHGDNDF